MLYICVLRIQVEFFSTLRSLKENIACTPSQLVFAITCDVFEVCAPHRIKVSKQKVACAPFVKEHTHIYTPTKNYYIINRCVTCHTPNERMKNTRTA